VAVGALVVAAGVAGGSSIGAQESAALGVACADARGDVIKRLNELTRSAESRSIGRARRCEPERESDCMEHDLSTSPPAHRAERAVTAKQSMPKPSVPVKCRREVYQSHFEICEEMNDLTVG
jgi:hypothetical protein